MGLRSKESVWVKRRQKERIIGPTLKHGHSIRPTPVILSLHWLPVQKTMICSKSVTHVIIGLNIEL